MEHQYCNLAVRSEAIRVLMDLADGRVKGRVIEEICNICGINKCELAAVLVSLPCETYNRADASNISRGNHYRDHQHPEKPPREATGADKQAHAKQLKAKQHDAMIEALVIELTALRREHGCEIVLENPVGSLKERPFMQSADWLQTVKRFTVTYCAYGYKYMKLTNIWTTMHDWQPEGITGDGMCNGRCGNGEKHMSEKRVTYRHQEQIAGPGDKQPKGGMAQLWSLPSMLTKELMKKIVQKQPNKKYVIDLFAGNESWRQAVEDESCVYIPVDIRRLLNRLSSKLPQTAQPDSSVQ